MQERSYKFGDLKRKLMESTNEFNPKFGDGVRSQEQTDSKKAYSDIEKETKAYNGGLTAPKTNNAGKSQLAQVNKGMSDLQYDGEVSKQFKERAKAGLRGATTPEEQKRRVKEPSGNATFDDAIAKEAERTASDVKKMQDAHSEIGITNAQKKKEDTHMHNTTIGENKKISLLKFKHVQFISESQMLAHVPDEYKNDGKKFYMQDCKGNKYLVEWHNEPNIEKMLNESAAKQEMDRIKYLFAYNGKANKTNSSIRMNEDKKIDDMLGRVRQLMK